MLQSDSRAAKQFVENEILINVSEGETRVAILEQGSFNELHIERANDRIVTGTVTLGRVTRVLPGMQAAFVDIGLEKAAFLYAGDYLAETGLVDPDLLRGGIGDASEDPQARSDLEPYRQGIGKLTVDLTEPGLDLDGEVVDASVGIGELLVLVPLDTDVTVDAHVGVGRAEVLGEEEDGVGVDVDSISGTSGSQEVTLELEVGVGNLRVERG